MYVCTYLLKTAPQIVNSYTSKKQKHLTKQGKRKWLYLINRLEDVKRESC